MNRWNAKIMVGDETVPLLLSHPEGAPWGAVLVYHGLYSNKEGNLKELESLAAAGALGIGVDAVGHGERAHPDLGRWIGEGDTHVNILQLVDRTAKEIPALLDAILAERPELKGRFGFCGISLGGFVGFRAMVIEPRIRAMVSLLGSPDWSMHTRTTDDPQILALLAKSPMSHPEKFVGRPLLAINAGQDENVDPAESRQFLERLRPLYGNNVERCAYQEYPDSGHFMREQDWDDAWHRSVSWFRSYLSGG